MKLHDLHPAKGAHHPRKRVGRGIAAGGGKTAGRGTKGQKARAGAAIPAWFEGGQTPLQMRIPKLHGFKNRFRVEYEVVNLGRISALVDAGIFEPGELPVGRKADTAARPALITINQEILRAAGLVSTLKKPLKVLGHGDLSVALFVVADAFSRSAVSKIEAAGGSVQVLEVPREPLAALGLDGPVEEPAADHGEVHADHTGHYHAAPGADEAAAGTIAAAAPDAEPHTDVEPAPAKVAKASKAKAPTAKADPAIAAPGPAAARSSEPKAVATKAAKPASAKPATVKPATAKPAAVAKATARKTSAKASEAPSGDA